MEEILMAANPNDGYQLPSSTISTLAYADDLVLFAHSPGALGLKLERVAAALRLAGMEINAAKSITFTISANTHNKNLCLENIAYTLDGVSIAAADTETRVKYLGLHFNWKGQISYKDTARLAGYCQELTSAPLKPQQRIHILRQVALPKLHHQLVLSSIHRRTLKAMDISCRHYVRRWLKLPQDTSTAFFHAKIGDGGLGLTSLATSIPLWRRTRLTKLITSEHPVVRDVVSICLTKALAVANEPVFVMGTVVNNKEEAAMAWKLAMYATSRQQRGRAQMDKLCRRGCGQTETLPHILQSCPAAHAARCVRHNRLAKSIAVSLRRKGYRVYEEPIIRTGTTYCKPDIMRARMG
ncbi:Retrovirus Pol polyprotein from type-1 retrotransposable element R2 [Fasciola gigantica]|uniref:Retrovirus Pol polyprotein from type-1 retrotransposable element R2 n=1 Tax=Fasciola gigantica TaxID=46835 RepID=A0A504YDH8_FASGI|nr:Retrovirus Pol polyprotein from type-1 retrotransposable element R2 [Fasciola gigantica]